MHAQPEAGPRDDGHLGITCVTSRTKPSSRISVCNIEKLGMGLGMRLAFTLSHADVLLPPLTIYTQQILLENVISYIDGLCMVCTTA